MSGVKKVWYAPNKFEAYGEEEIAEVNACLRDGWLAPGPRTAKFEEAVSAYFGKKYGVFVNSGSSANIIGLAVLNLPKGSEVVTPALNFATCVAPIEQLGLKSVFCDVELGRFVPSIDAIMAVVTPQTKILMIPNLVGSKIDWAELKKRCLAINRPDIITFEDSCDTMTYTPESDMSAISFYASHVITAGGCGGMIMFNDAKLQKRALMFRDWGRIGNNSESMGERFVHTIDGIEFDDKFLYEVLGYNMKCCEMNAAFGLVQLGKLEKFKQVRRDHIARYCNNLKGTSYMVPVDPEKYDWLAMPLLHKNRSGLVRYLEDNEVQIRVCFSGNITRHKPFRHYLKSYPEADRVMANGFLIGAHHGLTVEDVDRVCALLVQFDKGEAPKEYYTSGAGLPLKELFEEKKEIDACDF